MAEFPNLVPNLDEIMREHEQPEEETRQEEQLDEIRQEEQPGEVPSVTPEAPATSQERAEKGKGKVREEEEVEAFVSDEAYSQWKKYYANKGFVTERRFKNPVTPFKEMIEQRGWESLCAHQKSGYTALVREFYSNLVGRKDGAVFVRGVWVSYEAKAINEAYGMAVHKHGSKFKKLLEKPDFGKIANKLTNGKVQLNQEEGRPRTVNRGSLTEEAKVWFYFLASVLVPTKHVCTVREQEAVLLYAILKGYKINVGVVIENSIMRYHEGNKRGLIPHPATITVLCLKAGVKGVWESEEEVPRASPLLLTGVSKGPRNQKKRGVLVENRDEAPAEGPEKETQRVADQGAEHPENSPDNNDFIFADNEGQDEGSPIDFSIPLASSPPVQNRNFQHGESSRGAQENSSILEALNAMQKRMDEREKEWNLQQEFREGIYEKELKRRDQQWEEELNRKEKEHEMELQRREQQWGEELNRREEQMRKILKQQGEEFKKEMKERDHNLLQKLKLSHEAFYNNQFERDSQLLTLIKKRDTEQEAKFGEQIKGFKFLYKSLQKDFENKLDDRDKKQKDTESYRQKEWLENLDLINNNLSKFLEVMTEMEHTMNGLGKRQDELNKKVDLSNEIFIEEQIERETKKRKERREMKFPEFPAHLGTLDLDPPDIFAPGNKKRKK